MAGGLPARRSSPTAATRRGRKRDELTQIALSSTILVTGAGTGIGEQATRALAEAGHTVYASLRDISGRNAERAKALRESSARNGLDVRVVDLDVGSQESANHAIQTMLDETGQIDVVVHNAAHLGIGVCEAFTAEQIRDILDTNALGSTASTARCCPTCARSRRGC